jgi:tetratricopeptide (TPR) repeat protein
MLRISHVFALVIAAAAVAHAQPDKKAQALQLAAESERAYKDGKFEKSAELLRKAHGIYPEPILLYNLGRALEGIGDTKAAVEAYEQYLHDAKQIDDRPAIERRLATLKSQLEKADTEAKDQAAKDQAAKDQAAKDQAAKDQAAKDQAAKDQAANDQAEKDRLAKEQAEKDKAARDQAEKDRLAKLAAEKQQQPSEDTVWGPWITIGAGGAAVLTGAVFGWRANANHDSAVSEPTQQAAADFQDTAKTQATVANVMFVVGGAAIIGGAIWEYYEWKRVPRIQVAPTGVAVTWTWR